MERQIIISGSRVVPERLKPIRFDGKRNEQVINGPYFDLSQRTGLMAIYDDASNERLAITSIYDEPRNPIIEEDVQDVFSSALS